MLWFFTDLHCVCETNTHSREEVSYSLCSVPVITSPQSAPTQHWQVDIPGNISKEGMKVSDSYVKHAAAGLLQYMQRSVNSLSLMCVMKSQWDVSWFHCSSVSPSVMTQTTGLSIHIALWIWSTHAFYMRSVKLWTMIKEWHRENSIGIFAIEIVLENSILFKIPVHIRVHFYFDSVNIACHINSFSPPHWNLRKQYNFDITYATNQGCWFVYGWYGYDNNILKEQICPTQYLNQPCVCCLDNHSCDTWYVTLGGCISKESMT